MSSLLASARGLWTWAVGRVGWHRHPQHPSATCCHPHLLPWGCLGVAPVLQALHLIPEWWCFPFTAGLTRPCLCYALSLHVPGHSLTRSAIHTSYPLLVAKPGRTQPASAVLPWRVEEPEFQALHPTGAGSALWGPCPGGGLEVCLTENSCGVWGWSALEQSSEAAESSPLKHQCVAIGSVVRGPDWELGHWICLVLTSE